MERRGLNLRKVLLGTILPVLRRLPPRVASNMVAGIVDASREHSRSPVGQQESRIESQ